MKTTSMKNERRMAGWLVLWCMGLLAMAVSSCDSELDAAAVPVYGGNHAGPQTAGQG